MILIVLQRKVTWRFEDEEKVKKHFHSKASHTLSQMFKMACQEGKRPEWIDNSVWNNLLKRGTCLFIDPDVIQLKRIVYPKKLDVCEPKDPFTCLRL